MVTDGIAILKLDPRELAMDGIVQFMLDYESAV